MAEFTGRIDVRAVRLFVAQLLDTLADCLKDGRWPVRDAAIIASGALLAYGVCDCTIAPRVAEHLADTVLEAEMQMHMRSTSVFYVK